MIPALDPSVEIVTIPTPKKRTVGVRQETDDDDDEAPKDPDTGLLLTTHALILAQCASVRGRSSRKH